jgi:alpha-D-ribose 1-methylphosphonate 5-triphosphate diphosphatase
VSVRLVGNVRAVLPDRVVDDATVVVADGRILAVEEGRCYRQAEDGHGAFCLPGLVDSHSDAIEREISPRPSTWFDPAFALGSLEAHLLGVGITVVFHGLRFGEGAVRERTPVPALPVVAAIADRSGRSSRVDHRVLFRVAARTERAVEHAVACMERLPAEGTTPLLSFEDHTPGQGQFRDLTRLEATLSANVGDGGDLRAEIARRMEDAAARLPIRHANLAAVRALAGSGQVRALAHDCADPAEVADAHGWGASVAEFPLSVEAARAAREHGMPVVMGAPNVLLGGSHSGNVRAEEVVASGCCTGLASDYAPASLLAAAFDLAGRRVVGLPEAVRLVTAGPAEVAGLPDRGALLPGRRADLVLVCLEGRWPRVRAVLPADP